MLFRSIASIFQETKIDPTIINGGVINSINNSAKLGKSDWSILEADESDGSFVFIPPTYSIITNIDREHMDYYGTMDKLNKYFENFVNKVPPFGKSFICLDDKNNKNLIKNNKNRKTRGHVRTRARSKNMVLIKFKIGRASCRERV